ncbi:uncharacterized protein METZ01_LOCUS493254, partial [marine metagenome]
MFFILGIINLQIEGKSYLFPLSL